MNSQYRLIVEAWVIEEGFTEGLRIWRDRYGENVTYRMMCRGENDFSKQKLRAGLLEGLEPESKPIPAVASTEEPKEPEIIQDWRKTTYGLMDERVLQKQRLRDLPDPEKREKRKEIAYRILDITEQLDVLYGMIWYYEKHGRVPILETEEEVMQDKKPQELLNLRTYISRARKMRESNDQKYHEQLEREINEMKIRIEELELEINGGE